VSSNFVPFAGHVCQGDGPWRLVPKKKKEKGGREIKERTTPRVMLTDMLRQSRGGQMGRAVGARSRGKKGADEPGWPVWDTRGGGSVLLG